ncbi:hypothetical protein [Nannocystis pusilla]|uniref:hypothetical protein n=1 Tax=Nannocystis pusilla TaxID=889268 RepID=UPI003DA2B797
MTPPLATLLSASLSALAGILLLLLCVVPGSEPELQDTPQEDGSREVSFRGARGVWVVCLGVGALLFALLAVASPPDESRVLALVFGVVSAVLFVHQLCAYQNRVTLRVTPGSPRPGESMQVHWSVTSPVHVWKTYATLLGQERTVLDNGRGPYIDTHTFHEAPVKAAGVVVIPAEGVPTLPGTSHSIAWVLRLTALFPMWPVLQIEVPIEVRGATAGAPPDIEPPASVAPQEIQLGLRIDGDHRSFAPGEPIAGVVTWERPRPPRRASLRLVCEAITAGAGKNHTITEALLDLATQPRVFARALDDPFRRQAASETSALAASDCRRFRFAGPAAPYSYAGTLFDLRWRLELVIDGEAQVFDLVIGPGREVAGRERKAAAAVGDRRPSAPV